MSCPRPNTERSNPKDLGELERDLRDRLWTAFLHSPRAQRGGDPGLALVSGFRDPGRQWDLRHDRVPGHECDNRYKGSPVTAVPAQFINGQWVGGSKHQHRKAADVGGVDLMWLFRNCATFGLWHTVSSENWHYEVRGNPKVPIIAYPGPCWDDPEPPAIEEYLDMTKDEFDAALANALKPIKDELADLHEQWIGNQEQAPDEALRQVLRKVDKRTADLWAHQFDKPKPKG